MPTPPEPARSAKRVVLIDADPATRELLEEWLGAAGWRVWQDEPSAAGAAGELADVAIVDVPRPRGGDDEAVGGVKARYPGVPILAISPTFLPNVLPCGACAQLLGVERVLPKPLVREQLIESVGVLAARSP